jgi:hypothetical protein
MLKEIQGRFQHKSLRNGKHPADKEQIVTGNKNFPGINASDPPLAPKDKEKNDDTEQEHYNFIFI